MINTGIDVSYSLRAGRGLVAGGAAAEIWKPLSCRGTAAKVNHRDNDFAIPSQRALYSLWLLVCARVNDCVDLVLCSCHIGSVRICEFGYLKIFINSAGTINILNPNIYMFDLLPPLLWNCQI